MTPQQAAEGEAAAKASERAIEVINSAGRFYMAQGDEAIAAAIKSIALAVHVHAEICNPPREEIPF